jgi:hypothetical protein
MRKLIGRATFIVLIVSLIALIAFFISWDRVRQGDVYGTYIARYPYGCERLTLKADGEYTQEADINKNPRIIIHKGKWHLGSDHSQVVLEKPLYIQNVAGALERDYMIPLDGVSAPSIHRLFPWSRVRLGSDQKVQYVKVKEPSEARLREKPTEEAEGLRRTIDRWIGGSVDGVTH